MIIFPFLLFCS
uniref:Uncharacterized protein n=1 Tax=Arundo donax TaxID=35708 RepID=A0A0A8YG00_ARUDO